MSNRKAQLRSVADSYFRGLSQRDLSLVPFAGDVVFRTPLAPGGSDVALQGRQAVLDFFGGIYAALESVTVIDHFSNDTLTAICARADVRLKNGKTLRVADVFHVNSNGEITEQENHYDPRPAMG